MHSSKLRGDNFDIRVHGRKQDHTAFLKAVKNTDRLGLVAHEPEQGAGAVTLVMAYVTAFYDRYRATNEKFYSLPGLLRVPGGRAFSQLSHV